MSLRTSLTSVAFILVVMASLFSLSQHESTVSQTTGTTPQATTTLPLFVSTVTIPQTSSTTSAPATNTTLIIAGTSYPINVRTGESVLEVMSALMSAGTITFTDHEYPSLGMFIDSINGKKNGDGRYWVYYVNGVDASKGVSSQKITTGDVIEWKYEKSY